MGSQLCKALYLQILDISGIIDHFHYTRGFGLANVFTAHGEDIVTFVVTIRVLGGCPYLPAVSENITVEN